MEHLQHLEHRPKVLTLSLTVLKNHFPSTRHYQRMRVAQEEILEFGAAHDCNATIEAPTGSGKTACEYAFLKASESQGGETLFLITPNKTILQQIAGEFPDLKVAMGRNEHDCLYYEDPYKADEIPCSLLTDCAHRVDQQTGETHEKGATPCPYLQQKYEAKQGGIVLSTMAFYLFTQLFSREFKTPDTLVIDEAHRFADVVRSVLSYEITDHHLEKSEELLQKIGAAAEAQTLRKFRLTMIRMAKKRLPGQKSILVGEEILRLMEVLEHVSISDLSKKVERAVKSGAVNVVEDRVTLRKLEVLLRDLRRYLKSFEYSLPTDTRQPLNYTYAFYQEEKGEGERVQYRLVVKCYYVAPLIKKILSPKTLSFSATIGNPEIFGHETGIHAPFYSGGKHFPAVNTKIFMPTDTPNLSVNERNAREPTKVLRRIARAVRDFAAKGHRSLVVTVSNVERDKFMMLAVEEGVNAVSYGNGVTAKDAALRFKGGEGDVLVGTAANYSEGIDLPKQTAPVTFFLRPGYPNPYDPASVFEERRFGSQRWQLWNYRVMIQALQVRGRNIRSNTDLGVTFFISQQFRRFVFASLPETLQPSYVGTKTFDDCIIEAQKLLV